MASYRGWFINMGQVLASMHKVLAPSFSPHPLSRAHTGEPGKWDRKVHPIVLAIGRVRSRRIRLSRHIACVTS